MASAVTLGLVSLVACSSDGRTLRPAGPNQTLSIITTTTVAPTTTGVAAQPGGGFVVTAPWPDGGLIDAADTCKGADTSPAISWSGVPATTQELAISLVDLDADNFVHWVVAGLDPASTGIAAGRVPAGAIQAANGFGEAKYGGPCPPDGQHKYLLTLYALGARSNLADGVAAASAIDQLQSGALANALVTGSFG
ncbi:MAG TPA: YbhB/YbcL family Raf kinase inhibitor-like protein [Acidimicrobiia bacterium]|nr:YbhB/YbcL family Raf kinase inhibitor-like protein [Acidimicrobiia bacterium]